MGLGRNYGGPKNICWHLGNCRILIRMWWIEIIVSILLMVGLYFVKKEQLFLQSIPWFTTENNTTGIALKIAIGVIMLITLCWSIYKYCKMNRIYKTTKVMMEEARYTKKDMDMYLLLKGIKGSMMFLFIIHCIPFLIIYPRLQIALTLVSLVTKMIFSHRIRILSKKMSIYCGQ